MNIKILKRKRAKYFASAVATAALLALSSQRSFGDRGQGSIRGAARQAPPARVEAPHAAPARQPEARHDQPEVHQPAPEVRHDDHPDVKHDDHAAPPPRPAPPAKRDWDDNDDDARHFGGYAHGGPDHARGERIHDLPDHHFDGIFNNVHYFWDDTGAYYLQQQDGQYLVVQPPPGVLIASLPDSAIPIMVGPTTYYYLDGVFYVAQDNGFAIVNPPAGIVVPVLPSGANQVVINGTVIYQFNGSNYQPSLQDGVTVYTVTPG